MHILNVVLGCVLRSMPVSLLCKSGLDYIPRMHTLKEAICVSSVNADEAILELPPVTEGRH
jgi:hypothetical protein